ncbi:Bug family tripartite tricarboxylate transporter substrate binding protein [Ramlibacter algicola]|uniref:Tripartite tricarboxylate transporter substrate binding protein n=1 Tax=Ramlibacter algicola TaxID=2795217 RepID=A0A934USK7_9BURK|nr:tripartite tricarboxylate transporter substrate binding protein [Ramlibacter algicola]MBK0393833.1 tripartite tricarboxylate transporter substrate binding protein [Ramlibacter algicola]
MKKTLAGLALAAAAATSAMAAYPEKPVTLVVPFPPGGSTDAIARVIAQELPKKLGGTWVVDNKPGATGTIGAAFVKRAAPDGYTLFVSSLGPFVIAPHLIKAVQYDALKDLDPITVAVQAPNVLVVPASSPYKNVAELIAGLKKTPGKISFASSGAGSSDHLSAELFWQQTDTSGVHIPYKGGGPAINDLLGAQVDAAFVNINSIISHIKAGKVRALGVASEKRNTLLPDLPTLAEQGVKGAEVQSWQAVAGPKGLPAEVKTKVRDAIASILNDPAVKDKLVAQGFEIVADTPEHFAKFQAAEFARWKNLIETRKITAD